MYVSVAKKYLLFNSTFYVLTITNYTVLSKHSSNVAGSNSHSAGKILSKTIKLTLCCIKSNVLSGYRWPKMITVF